MKSKTIGIIGGGQLGLMLIEEIHKLGHLAICLDPNMDACAFKLSDDYICADFSDIEALNLLCEKSDVVTYEFENVNGDILKDLALKYNLKQGYNQLLDSQDRLIEKNNAINNGFRTAKFIAVKDKKEIEEALNSLTFPCIYKTRKFGYDGHGQVVLNNVQDISKLEKYFGIDAIIEEFVDFDFEVSVILVRAENQVINFPIIRNIHKNNILNISYIPANISENVETSIINLSKKFMFDNNYFGILTIEFFVKEDLFYFNEMAPRPHNSGHLTIEGCNTNQFRELAMYLLDLDLTTPLMNKPTLMKNLLGKDILEDRKYLDFSDKFFHIYGKKDLKDLRKMGHVTFYNTTIEQFKEVEDE